MSRQPRPLRSRGRAPMIPPGLVLAGTEAQHGSTHDQSRICGVVWSYVMAVVEVEALRRGHGRRETCDREIDPLSQPRRLRATFAPLTILSSLPQNLPQNASERSKRKL